MGILTINALNASTHLLIPAKADIYSLHGIDKLFQTVEVIRIHCNPNLKISGILVTGYSHRTIINRDISATIEKIAKQFDISTFTTKIRECIAIKEAQAQQIHIQSYAPLSNASQDYEHFIEEFLKGVNNE